MFNFGIRPKHFWEKSENSHVQRVLDLYIRRHRDDLLGLGYHQFIQMGRGVLVLKCRYRDLFFNKGLSPIRQYLISQDLIAQNLIVADKSHLLEEIHDYDTSTEILVSLQVDDMALKQVCRLSKRGLALSVIHRQYLNHLLDYVATPSVALPEGS